MSIRTLARVARSFRALCALALTGMALLASPGRAHAQSCDWQYNFSIGQPGLLSPGSGSSVYDFEAINDDIVAGGYFFNAGNVTNSPMCARWDGTQWNPMGAGFSSSVYSLSWYHGELYAFGQYAYAWPNLAWRAAKWNGSAWQPLGNDQGLQRPSNVQNGYAYASVVYGDSLIVGGGFTRAGDQAVGLVAAWDGAAWHPMGAGFDSLVSDSGACAWPFVPYIKALCEFRGDLYAGGTFRLTATGDVVHGLARWDGTSWQPMGAGIGAIPEDCAQPNILAMTVWNDNLVIGGSFRTVDGQQFARVARWDGTNWYSMGTAWGVKYGDIWTLETTPQGELFAGGRRQNQFAPNDPWQLTRWNGTDWEHIGPNLTWITTTNVANIFTHGDDMYIGGGFTGTEDGDTTNFIAQLHCNGVTAVEPFADAAGVSMSLAGANPFAGFTRIAFDLPREANAVRLEIYDAAGRHVRTLLDGPMSAGRQTVAWRGRDDDGVRVASGVYFARLDVGGEVRAMRVVKL